MYKIKSRHFTSGDQRRFHPKEIRDASRGLRLDMDHLLVDGAAFARGDHCVFPFRSGGDLPLVRLYYKCYNFKSNHTYCVVHIRQGISVLATSKTPQLVPFSTRGVFVYQYFPGGMCLYLMRSRTTCRHQYGSEGLPLHVTNRLPSLILWIAPCRLWRTNSSPCGFMMSFSRLYSLAIITPAFSEW